MALLTRIFARQPFSLPDFALAPLEFETGPGALAEPQMPTPGELRERIELHLNGGAPAIAGTDAAAELRDALLELRRSLG